MSKRTCDRRCQADLDERDEAGNLTGIIICEAEATHYSRCCGYACREHKCRHARPVEDFWIPSHWFAT